MSFGALIGVPTCRAAERARRQGPGVYRTTCGSGSDQPGFPPAGTQNYKVPAEMTAGAKGYHTVVPWDTAMKDAIAAALLAVK